MILRTAGSGKGVTIVEFALVLPLLLVLIFTIIDFGLYFFAQHTVQFATREGVRLALVGRTLTDASGDPLSREGSIVKMITDKAAVAISPSALQISIYPVNPDYSDPANWRNTQDAGMPGDYMRVRTRYEYRFITPLLRVRWDVNVGGVHHLPARAGALLVTNERRLSWSPLYVSWALAQATAPRVEPASRPRRATPSGRGTGPRSRRSGNRCRR